MDTPKILTLPAIPIRDMVLFPGSRVPFVVGRKGSVRTLELAIKAGDHLVMLTQMEPKEDEPKQETLYPTGTLALVESLIELPKNFYKVSVKGIARVKLERYSDEGDVIQADVSILTEPAAPAEDETMLAAFFGAVEQFLSRNPDASRLMSIDQIREQPLGRSIDTVAGLLPSDVREKQGVLEQLEIELRLQAVLKLLEVDAARHSVDQVLEEKTRARLDEDHKQYVLSEKMRVLQQEMGKKGEKDEFSRLKDQILEAHMSEEAEKKALEELARLEAMPPQSAESTVSRTYIDWLLALPWQQLADEHLDLDEAEAILEEDHAGLEKVKARILEYLAVMRLLKDSDGSAEDLPSSRPEAGGPGDPTHAPGQKPEGLGGPTRKGSVSDSALPRPEAGGPGGTQKPEGLGGPTRKGSALRGPILCLVGPPGVGKTSLARSIARALNRPFLRFSLGGLRDEAEIRGHRRTYIGAMPGRIISLMKKSGVKNPLMLLDELDKMASDWRGDPASALLEVLDPEQNQAFQDHYLDLGYDLSQVLFLCTANVRHAIPQALEDRLEVIELSGYTLKEKLAIAQRHLLPKALERHGMKGLDIAFRDSALEKIIQAYTKEAGVRQLEREISSVLRKLARHSLQPDKGDLAGEVFKAVVTPERLPKLIGPERFMETPRDEQVLPGVVNGLAWTSTGGDLLTMEAATLPGKGNLKLTGKLGEVMQESAQIALSFVRARAERLGLAPNFMEKMDLHVHVPEGAIPKDGPSAGITMATALISALTGIPVRSDLAMTGELTLRGRVLPIGGLKEKLLAAHRLGCVTVLIPSENARHLEEIPSEVREQMTIHLVNHMDDVIPLALSRMPEPVQREAAPCAP